MAYNTYAYYEKRLRKPGFGMSQKMFDNLPDRSPEDAELHREMQRQRIEQQTGYPCTSVPCGVVQEFPPTSIQLVHNPSIINACIKK
jgi:hypothetical protein